MINSSIIRALPEQADILTHITIASKRYWNYPERWMQIWLPLLTMSPAYISENEVWVKIFGDKPVAYYSLQQAGSELWLDNLWILPEFIGRGIGKELFLHAVERSRQCDGTILKIEADPNAEPFYEKMGAQRVGEHHSEADGHSRILPIMEIKI